MPTGACGIHCDVCGLHLKGLCSTCGPGTSEAGAAKAAAQARILGAPCPILACARLNHIGYCMADCRDFPCPNFNNGPYPFSEAFLSMQQRRKHDTPPAYAPDGSHLEVDSLYWEAAAARDPEQVRNLTFFELIQPGLLQFRFLREEIRIDLTGRTLLRQDDSGTWQPRKDPLLTLATVLYLKNIQQIYPMGQDIVAAKELKEGHFFSGPHLFRTDPLLNRFGQDVEGFKKACQALDGKPVAMADAAFQLLPFPRVPLYFLLWAGDEEFKPRVQVLFDRPIESVLPADAIWALVNRVVMAFGGL
ncbi:MAG: DUF3786 domain-containing protein [Desulfobacteraceae bacterium]|nr:DUF3786 domain-containing protein [Desulfobacteraceae bacterium]